jgi:hypothetical protein
MQESTIEKEIRAAFARRGWSIDELIRRSGLRISRGNLKRKLVGDNRAGRGSYVGISPSQCETLVRTLGGELVIAFPDSTVTIGDGRSSRRLPRAA